VSGARRRLAGVLACTALGALAGGCGSSVEAADLFVVTRSGSGPHAALTLLVNEEGIVHCNGRKAGTLADAQIVKARGITEDLEKPASEGLSLPPRPGSVFRYRLRDANGTVSFADNSSGQPKVLHELALFVLQTSQRVCGLPE
jgi:hypothetical protein